MRHSSELLDAWFADENKDVGRILGHRSLALFKLIYEGDYQMVDLYFAYEKVGFSKVKGNVFYRDVPGITDKVIAEFKNLMSLRLDCSPEDVLITFITKLDKEN